MKKILSIFALVLCAITLPLGLVGCKKAKTGNESAKYFGKWTLDKIEYKESTIPQDATENFVKHATELLKDAYLNLKSDYTYETNMVKYIDLIHNSDRIYKEDFSKTAELQNYDSDHQNFKYLYNDWAIANSKLLFGGFCSWDYVEEKGGQTDTYTEFFMFNVSEFPNNEMLINLWQAKDNLIVITFCLDGDITNNIVEITLKKA